MRYLVLLLVACSNSPGSGSADSASASRYVSSKQATKIVFEIDHVKGRVPNEGSIGFAYGGDRIVMFADTIKKACAASVLVHEFGHLPSRHPTRRA